MTKFCLVVVAATLSAAPAPAAAAAIVAFELLEDLLPLDPFSSDLSRVRSSTGTGTLTESNDAIVAAQNSISSSFGILTSADVSYIHYINWVQPSLALDIFIDKNVIGGLGEVNAFSVYPSQLDITYEPVVITPTAAVPEPATVALLGTGLVALAARARRRKKK